MAFMNNIPTALRHGDFMAMHSDMVGAARGDVLSKEQLEQARKPRGRLEYDPVADRLLCLGSDGRLRVVLPSCIRLFDGQA